MIDNDMTNILKNFTNVGTGEIVDAKTGEAKVSTAATEKNAMKTLLEGLDAQQKSVNQMPGAHKMASGYDKKHPADKFLVGGEYDDDLEEDITEMFSTGAAGFKVFQVDNKVYKSLQGWFPEAQTTFNPKDKTATIHFNGPVTDEIDSKMDRFHSNWQTNAMALREENSARAGIMPGVNVHIGHHVPGGSGVEGKVTKVKDGYVYIKNAEGRTYKGQLKNTTISEAISESGKLRSVKVNFDDGNSITTNMAANISDDQIRNYYAVGKRFNLGQTGNEKMATVTDVQILETAVEEDTISKREQPKIEMNKKQSLADLFRSMEETEEDVAERFKKELHDERQERELKKGENGKFNLAEEPVSESSMSTTANFDHLVADMKRLMSQGRTINVKARNTPGTPRFEGVIVDYEITDAAEADDSGWGDELIEALKLLVQQQNQQPEDIASGVEDLIMQYEDPTKV